MSNEKKTDHNYDGIEELDNDLPRWWVIQFYLSIVFAIFYIIYYEFGNGMSLQEEFQREVDEIEARVMMQPKAEFPNQTKLAEFRKDPSKLANGKVVFQARCASCHGDKGQGVIGPNLTDRYWIHGDGKAAAIAKVIHDGVLEKGMPAWGAVLSADEMYEVSAYVHGLQEHEVAGKEAQGQLQKE